MVLTTDEQGILGELTSLYWSKHRIYNNPIMSLQGFCWLIMVLFVVRRNKGENANQKLNLYC